MNKNKLLKSLVGTAALTISLSGVANTYALAAETDNAGEEVNKPASNLVVDNKEDKSQTPDVEVNKEKGEVIITFKDEDGNPTETKTVELGEVEKTPDKDNKEEPGEDNKEEPGEDNKEEPGEEEEPGEDEEGVDEEEPGEDKEEPGEDDDSEKVGNEPRIVFSVKDGEPLKINVGSTWNPFNHAAAIDSEDGNLTDKIVYEGDVDVQTPGIYEVTYTVTDSDGNEVSEVLTVQVGEGAEEEGTKDDCNTCDNGGVEINVDNENTLNGEVENSGEVQAGEVNEENKTEEGEGDDNDTEKPGEGEGDNDTEKPGNGEGEGDNDTEKPGEGEGEGDNDTEKPGEGGEESDDEESDGEEPKDGKVTVVENDDDGKGSGEGVYDSSDVTKDQKKGDLPDTGVENTSNAGLIASIGAMFAAMGAFLFGRRKSSNKQ